MDRLPGRWRGRKALSTAVLLATLSAVAFVPRSAAACHAAIDPTAYDPCDQARVGFFMGLTLAPRLLVSYGVEVSYGDGPVAVVVRLEAHGWSHLKLSATGQFTMPNTRATFEFGFAARSGRREVGRSYGLHLASGVWDELHYRSVRFGGTMPLAGDLRNFDVGLGAFTNVRCVPSLLGGKWEGRCE